MSPRTRTSRTPWRERKVQAVLLNTAFNTRAFGLRARIAQGRESLRLRGSDETGLKLRDTYATASRGLSFARVVGPRLRRRSQREVAPGREHVARIVERVHARDTRRHRRLGGGSVSCVGAHGRLSEIKKLHWSRVISNRAGRSLPTPRPVGDTTGTPGGEADLHSPIAG